MKYLIILSSLLTGCFNNNFDNINSDLQEINEINRKNLAMINEIRCILEIKPHQGKELTLKLIKNCEEKFKVK